MYNVSNFNIELLCNFLLFFKQNVEENRTRVAKSRNLHITIVLLFFLTLKQNTEVYEEEDSTSFPAKTRHPAGSPPKQQIMRILPPSRENSTEHYTKISLSFQTLKQNTEVREEENRTRILPPKREISTQTPLPTVGIANFQITFTLLYAIYSDFYSCNIHLAKFLTLPMVFSIYLRNDCLKFFETWHLS